MLFLCIWSVPLRAQFTDVTRAAGIHFVHDGAKVSKLGMGSGAAWLDFNNDGCLDIYVTRRASANALYRNNCDGTFTDVAAQMGVDDAQGDGAGVAAADFNNDGWPDLFLVNGGEDRLFKNIQGKRFKTISLRAGITVSKDSRGTTASWGDYDNDGWLDLYVAHHHPEVGARDETFNDFLFHNNGNETFTDVSYLIPEEYRQGPGFIGGWTDIEKDGDLDIILINDCPYLPKWDQTMIFRNDGGEDPLHWSFTEASLAFGIDDCRNGMGLAVGDYNRDGWQDIFYTNIGECVLFENRAGHFVDVTERAGVAGPGEKFYSWGTSFFDYDLDGWLDLVVTMGALWTDRPVAHPNILFRNDGKGTTFSDVSASLGFEDTRQSRSAVFGDYDNDGDPDIFMVNYNDEAILYKNENNNGNHWLKIKLAGTESNRDGIGAEIRITTDDGLHQYFETRSGSNLGGGDDIQAYFGLGSHDRVRQIEINWPSGIVQVLENVAADQFVEIKEAGKPMGGLISFRVSLEILNRKINLQWEVTSDEPTDFYTVQRSEDGARFRNLARIAVTTNGTYSYTDEAPIVGKSYYRVRRVGKTGEPAFSEALAVEFLEPEEPIEIFPNPVFNNQINIRFKRTSMLEVVLVDGLGRRVMQQKFEVAGSNVVAVNVEGLDNGLYFLQVCSDVLLIMQKILIMHE